MFGHDRCPGGQRSHRAGSDTQSFRNRFHPCARAQTALVFSNRFLARIPRRCATPGRSFLLAAFSSRHSPLQSNRFEAAFPFAIHVCGAPCRACLVCGVLRCSAGARVHDREAANSGSLCGCAGTAHSNRSGLSPEEYRESTAGRPRAAAAGETAVSL